TVHGVVLELGGRGILITGPSGIGKTTAAMQAVGEGYAWIADDVAMIRKNQG
ncbi:MAG TPA: HPr(Ser) kinase/phosphatase, partial [Syntrophaceae bacterium]|nr:HPr(Ser) kinase/phosphatase [Syntrophaceae bacterium]